MDWDQVPQVKVEPDFNNLLAVLRRERPNRPTLFEFALNERLFTRVAPEIPVGTDAFSALKRKVTVFSRLGYDYATMLVPDFSFSEGLVVRHPGRTVSLNEGSVIHTRADFESFPFPDPDQANYAVLEQIEPELPDGFRLILTTPDGILENVTDLVGYEALCLMVLDDPALAQAIFDEVGARLLRYYERALEYPSIGACIANDDWGFKTHTMFAPRDMRRLVFPWYRRIVSLIHEAGRPAILHSCGHFEKIIDEIVNDMRFDARHSYEDSILPVEVAYARYGSRIAILGGIDVDFVCRSSPQEVYRRSKAMLARTNSRGYALGTGNSVPDYVPDANYFAMIRAALEER